jgi:hypothetical protein
MMVSPPPEWRFVRVVGPTGRYADHPFMLDSGADVGLIPLPVARRLALEYLGPSTVTNSRDRAEQDTVAADLYVEGQGPFHVEMLVSGGVFALGRDVIGQIGMSIPANDAFVNDGL